MSSKSGVSASHSMCITSFVNGIYRLKRSGVLAHIAAVRADLKM